MCVNPSLMSWELMLCLQQVLALVFDGFCVN